MDPIQNSGEGGWRLPYSLKVFLLILCPLLGPMSGRAGIPGHDWWFAAPADAAWTKKPFAEIEAAAAHNDPAGQYYLGYMFFFGQGCNQDVAKAFLWIRRSAEQGYAQAQLLTARFYFAGLGANRDHTEAVRWVSRAAHQGHADAMALLGLAHASGEGTPRNATNALMWFQRGVKAGSRVASAWLGDFYLKGEGGTARRTNYVEALRCYERAASNGLASAAMQLAEMYDKGLGTPPDFPRAFQLVRLFADKTNPDALEKLAAFYAAERAEPRGPDDKAIWLLRKAAVLRANNFHETGERSNPLIEDCRDLWSRYRYGIGTPRDYVATAEWMWLPCQEDFRRGAAGQRKS